MRYDLESTLPERAFKKSLFKNAPATLEGGKGGGGTPAPTQSTAYQTNIPEYAKPYVTNMLNATQNQLFNTQKTTNEAGEESTEITGFKPYKPYSSNPADYYAGFSPMQQQAQSSAANLQTPGQFGQGSAMTGMAGLGALGTTRQAGMYGGLGAQAGLGFGQQAQDPNAVMNYMNPYLQASLNPQLAEIQRQYDITGQGEQSAATKQGAFGGSREALMAAENQRNKNMAMNQVIGQGYNQAFNNAQQQMATAAQLGMQGAQAGLQGVGAQQAGYGQLGQAGAGLANIGGQELAAQQGIIGTQAQQGAQQQALEQSKINQAVQDYGTAQQYPMLQLGLMSNMLRGLPMQSTAVQSYQAQAPVAQQAAGLLGAYNAYAGKKEGGAIKAMAKGGIADIPGYKSGVLVGLENKIDDIAQSDAYAQEGQKQLPKLMQQTTSPGIKQLIATKQAEDQLGQNISGVAAGDTGDLGFNMAEGGIIPRFATGTEVKDPYGLTTAAAEASKGYATPEEALTTQQGLLASGLKNVQANLSPEEQEQQKYVQERRAGLSDKQRRAEKMNEALAFLKFGSTVGGLGTAAIEGAKSYMTGQGEIQNKYDDLNDSLVKQAAEIKKAQRAEAKGDIDKAQTHFDKAAKYKLDAIKDNATLLNTLETHKMDNTSRERVAQINAAVHGLTGRTAAEEKAAIAKDLEKELGRPPTTKEVLNVYTQATRGYDESQNTRIAGDAEKALQDWVKGRVLTPGWQKMSPQEQETAINTEYEKIVKRMKGTAQIGTTTLKPPPEQSNNSLIMDGYKFPDQKSLDEYKAAKAKAKQ
jgi:hypothetical protein